MSKKPKTSMKIDENYSCLLNYLRSFNEIFRKDVTHDNIKSHKKQGYTLSLEDEFFKKSQRCGGQINHPPPPPPPQPLLSRFRVNPFSPRHHLPYFPRAK